jgi:8-oxo-dGTP pyrophosphatase MutT (NUDIX family)
MAIEKSAGAVIFRREEGKIFYLLLRYPRGGRRKDCYWDFPKGHIDKGEKIIDTAKREVAEETGLTDVSFLEGFKETFKYFFKLKEENILKFVTFFLAETKTKKVKISSEHTGYIWLSYEKALKKITYENAKNILGKADNFLK